MTDATREAALRFAMERYLSLSLSAMDTRAEVTGHLRLSLHRFLILVFGILSSALVESGSVIRFQPPGPATNARRGESDPSADPHRRVADRDTPHGEVRS